MAALPFIFATNDIHIISSATLQNANAPTQIAKLFFKPHVEDIKKEFFDIKAMGAGTAEEWLKGLDKRGKEKRNDAFKWERWEQTGGVRRMQTGDRIWFHEDTAQFKLTITPTSTASAEATRPLAGNSGSRQQGPGDAMTQFGAYITQAEQPIGASFCKFPSASDPIYEKCRLTLPHSYEYASPI
jgi:hypothetical protein